MRRKPRREKTMRKMSLTVSILGAFLTAALLPLAGRAGTYDLTIAKTAVNVSGKPETAMTVNGQLHGPALRFKEGEDVVLNVKNDMDVDTSLNWHGNNLPYTQDRDPGINFPGLNPGEPFTNRFTH